RLGSVIGLTDGSGTLVVGYRYDPWGNLLAVDGSNPNLENPFRFTGREWDAESGLYYYRLRYYDPTIGRFITPDPVASGYAYASDNPVNATDPTGAWTVAGIIVGGIGGAVAIATAPVWLPALGITAAAGTATATIATAVGAAAAGTGAG